MTTVTVTINAHGNGGYSRGCRCDTCKADKTLHGKAYTRAERAAARWVKDRYPGVWDEILADEKAELGIVNRPPGRPRSPLKKNYGATGA